MKPDAKKAAPVRAALSNHYPSDLDGEGEMNHSNANVLSISSAKPTAWTWRGAAFVKIQPGKYMACCSGWKGPEWVPAYRRYSFRLIFRPIAEDVDITMFINFGKSPEPPRSIASRYFKAWTMANGEAPLLGQPMVPTVFVEPGLTYVIEVEDASIDPTTKEDRPACLVYSRVKEIQSCRRP